MRFFGLSTFLIAVFFAGTISASAPPLEITVVSDAATFRAGQEVDVNVRVKNTSAHPFTFYTGDLTAEFCWAKSRPRGWSFGCGGRVRTCVEAAGISPASGAVESSGTDCDGPKLVLGPGESQAVTLVVVVPKEAAGKGNVAKLVFRLDTSFRNLKADPDAWLGRYEFAREPIVIRAKETILRGTDRKGRER